MKRSNTSSRRVRTRDRHSFARPSSQVRRRAATFKLESLEERTLLSVSSSIESALSQTLLNLSRDAVPSRSPDSSIDATASQQSVGPSLPAGLLQSIRDAGTVATVTTSPTSSTTTVAGLNAPVHIYNGQPQNFTGAPSPTSVPPVTPVTTSNPGHYNPNAPSQAAMEALGKTLRATPQYLILPSTTTTGASPLSGEGPGGGYTPLQIQGAYGVSTGGSTYNDNINFLGIKGDGAGQTIALIDAGDDSNFVSTSDPNYDASALHVFDQEFGLPDPPSFQKYDQYGNPGGTGVDLGWDGEIALDVEWAHAMAPAANIILVEGYSSTFSDLGTAAKTAGTILGASVVSQSFGGYLEAAGDGAFEQYLDQTYYAPALASNPGLTFLAATGDGGAFSGPLYPAISPLTVGAGGTSLYTNGNTWTNETGWSGSGGGISNTYPAPSFQQAVTGYSARTNPDISLVADPSTGLSVYSPNNGGWLLVGGTSAATPTWAGLISIADQGRTLLGGQPLNGPNQTLSGLYSAIDYTNNYHDITVGNNGFPAGPGYDLVTGIGSPRAEGIIPYLSTYDLGPHVVSSSPAAGSIVTTTPPTTFSLTFNEPLVPSSVVASDFTVDGTPADSASLSPDDMTITYSFNTSPVTTQGSQTMNLPAQSVIGADGPNLVPFSATFDYVQTQLQVTATSPAVGSVLTVPVTDLVVQFNEAFNLTTLNTSDFQLSQGSVVGAVPLTPTSVDLTLSGITQDGTLTLTVPAGVILDNYGVGNAAFSGTYIVQVNSQPYPTPLAAQDPAGSLIYDPSVTGAINFLGDTDTYTLPLAAGQTLSAVLSTDPTLTGVISLYDPSNNLIATATAPSAGADAVLETAPITTAGTYSLVVSGSGPGFGNYTLQAILNAAYKPASGTNNMIGTAYDLTSAFTSLGTTPYADRAGVLGTIDPSSDTDFYKFYLNAGQSTTLAAAGLNSGAVGLGFFDSSGNLLALPAGATGQGSIDLGGGFAGAGSVLTVNGSAQISGSNLELTDGGYSEAGSAFNSNQVYIGNFSTSFNFQITPGTIPTADGFTFTIQGAGANALGGNGYDLGYGGITPSVAIKFDLYNNAGEGTDSTGLYIDGAPPTVPAIDLTGTGIDLHSGDVFNVAMNYDGSTLNVTITDTNTSASASQSYSVNIPSIIGGNGAYVGFTGGTGGLTSVQNIQNWTFTPAQTFISPHAFESINNFVAPASGWYYAGVSGNAGTNYSLVVTRGSDFDIHGNSFANAQPLDGVNVVLGSIQNYPVPALQALDLQAFSYSNIYATNPTTGAFGSSITSPTNDGFYLFGQNMASDGNYTYYSDGYGGSGTIFKLDPTGAVVASTTGPDSDLYTGLAYLNGKLYAVAPDNSNIYIYDASTLAFLGTITNNVTDSALVGLAGDPDNGMLYAVGQVGPGVDGELYEINPTTGATIQEALDNNQGSYEQDMAYANGMLIVSEVGGAAGLGALDEYDPNTLGFLQRVTPPYHYDASGLAGDGIGGQSPDWYQFNVNAGDNLVITTTTPGATTASGLQFANDLDPTINLYDASGNLVATATGNAADGRNSVIDFTALTPGSYRVQVEGASATNLGEYTLSIQGATGGAAPFTVTSTTPAAGSDIGYQVSTMTVSVSSSIYLSSVSPSDFTIDGNPATGVTVLDGQDLSFTFPTTADGVHNVSISGLTNLQGTALTPDSFSFETDDVPPVVVSSSIADGAVLAPGNVTEVITFSKPIQPSSVSTSDISLLGEIRGISYTPTFSFDPTDTILTVNYANLPTDAYQFTLDAGPGNFLSLAGVPLQNNYVVNFTIPGGTSTISGLQPVLPLGSLVYQETVDNLLLSSSDVDTYNLAIDPQQTLAVVVTPVTTSMTVTVTLISPTGNTLGSATSPSPGAPAVLYGVQSSRGGTYQFTVSGGPGEYTIQPILNAYVDPAAYGGTLNTSIATATPVDPYGNNFIGQDNRTAVLGALSAPTSGGMVVTDRNSQGLYSVNTGTGATTEIGSLSYLTSLSGMAIDPSTNTTYISDVFNGFWSLATIDRSTGQETIIGPQYDPTFGEYDSDIHALVFSDGTLYGFSYTRGLGVMNTSNGEFTPDLPSDSMPEVIENATIAPDGTVYAVGDFTGDIYTINLSTAQATFVGNPGTGGSFFTTGLAYSGGSLYELAYNGTFSPPLLQIDPSTIAGTIVGPASILEPDAMTAPLATTSGPTETQATYSFALNQGESATIALESLNGKKGSFTLYDDEGDVLGLSAPDAANYTAGLNNFVAPNDGTYYVQVTGDPGLQFNLVVTRGADFTTQPHTTIATAQDITATQLSGNSRQGGALGYLSNPSGAQIGTTIEGIDFNGSNCGCLPPDTNAAVGNGFVAETVNFQFRVWDTSGNQLLDEPLSTLFGGATDGDPYVEYDSIAQRWFVTAIDAVNPGDEWLAVSNDANPTDGFSSVYEVPLAAPGDLPDFTKFGYNADALVMEAQDFSSTTGSFLQTVVTSVDINALLSGTLTYYQSVPPAEFRALTPAQMHGAAPGAPMWFISTDGYNFPASTIRVTEMTNELSSSPTYMTFSLPVNTFNFTTLADQPGAPGSVETNDPTTTSVDYLGGLMVTALAATDASDGFQQTHVHWYEVDVSSGTPVLVQEGLINPGPGVATYFGAAAIDPAGNIGLSYMESSSTEYVSAYVAGHIAGTPLGTTTAGAVFAPGGGSMPDSQREGDYGSAVYDPGTGLFWGANEYIGSDGSTDIWRTKITSFSVSSSIGTDFYSVNANAGDNLHFATSTPAGGPNEFVNNFYPELLLYDPNGNLVAVAAGNASDGRNSVIDFTVPAGDAGKWVIEVTPSPNTETPSSGEYGLLVTGATGSLSPFVVTATTPAAGALVQPPTDIIVTFNDPVLGTSLTPGELEVNGVAATAVSMVNADTVDWSVPPSAYATGIDLPNIVTIGADSSGNQVTDVSGQTLTPYSYTFYTTNVAPYIVSSSIDGSVFSPAPANVTEVVTFSQPMDTSFTTQSSFDLLGNYRNVQYAAASFSWDPTDTILTINYNNLPDDTYTLTLYASGFENSVGIPLASNYVANFAVALGTAAFPTPLTPVPPLGDLIYTGTDNHVLVTPTDVDSLTLALNAGETLTLVGTPTSSALQLVITVLDPGNNTIGTATASAPGQAVTLETVPVASTGTYTIQISDAGGNLGLYSIQAYLNSYIKQGTSNDTIGTAQDLSSSSYLLGPGDADRLAVVGSLPSNIITPGTVFVSSRYYGDYFSAQTISDILEVNAAGQIVNVFPVSNDPYLSLAGVELDPVNNMLYAAVTTSFNTNSVSGELLEFNPLTGQQVATIPLPDDPADIGYYYPYGFSIASDGSFWISQPNSENIIHLDPSGNLLQSFSVSGMTPESASIGSDGNVYFTGLNGPDGNAIYELNTTTGAVSYFAYSPSPNITSTAPGGTGIWTGDFDLGAVLYNYSGSNVQQVGYFGTNNAQDDPSGNVWTANPAFYDLFRFDQYGNQQLAVFVPDPIGVTTWGVDNPNPPAQDTQDYYSFALTQGQSATVVAESLNGLNLQITLVDGSGNVLATGVGGSTNVTQSIQNFVAPATGTYYVEISGDPGLQYSLAVTRGAAFSVQDHHTYSTAQDLTGTNGVLGYLAPPVSPLYTLDDQEGLFGNAQNPIWATDPATGLFIPPSINAPGNPANNPFGENLAFDGTYLYYNDGSQFGDNTIYKLDPTTGAVVASGVPAGTPLFTGLAYLNGELYGIAAFNSTIYVIDPTTFQVVSTLTTNIANTNVVGLAGDPDRGVLWAVTQPFTTSGDIDEINPNTGNVIASAPDNHVGYVQDIAYAGGQLIVSDTLGFGAGSNYLDYYDPNTLAFIQRLPVATLGLVAGLGGDGLGGAPKDDWYTVNVQAGQQLYLQSSTPSDQGGQFPNTASLEISLYDTFGNLVATGTKLADGRNEALFYNAPVSGQYHIEVSEDPGGQGEYYLSVETATYQSGDISGEVYNDLNGSGTLLPGDPGLDNWEVDVYDSNNNFVASQLTSGGGNFDFAGLAPGTYTISEVLQTGWTQTAPPTGSFTVTVTAGGTASGNDFGNFQNITISGETFNDLNGNGTLDPGEPGLSGWTVDLYDASNNLIATTVTDVNGDYSFADVGPGTYTVQEVLQAGWIQTTPAPPGTFTVTATSGQNSTGLLFGNYQFVTYSGTVYNDLNGSGMIAPGDPGLQGWTVELLDTHGNIVATTTSAADGSYSFADLTYGVYTIEEVTQTGWYQTEPPNPFVYTVTATSGASQSGLNFGNFQAVNVTGEVYNDLNGNGNLDPGEPGLPGWTVLLLDPAGNTVATTTSDANGDYQFDNLFPGTFTVEEILQSGWIQTQPVNPNYYQFTTQSGLNETGLNFGNFVNSENFYGTVYNDLNGNGNLDPGEPGLSGWTINVLNSSNIVVATTTSASAGGYYFNNLPVQPYTIEEITMSGWIITQPTNPPGTYTLPGNSGVYTGLDFGNFQLVSVSGNVYNDLNGNGTRDPGEPGLSHWTVDVLNTGGTVVASALSNSQGDYTVTGVGPGSYTLAEVLQSGWIQTQPVNPTYYSFTTTSGVNITGGVFGNFKAVSVAGNVYNDLNGNGLKGAGEPGLSGWTVDLEDSSGNILASVLTDANGNYAFTGVGGGSYQVAEVVQINWVQTQPLYPTVYSFTSRSGTNLLALNFGDHASPALSPSNVIDNGQPGYSETGSWSTVVGGFNGTNRVAKTVHAGGPQSTATWNFSGISAGTYDVYVTYAGKSGYSSAAPFTVYDSSTSLGTQDINQSILVTQSQGGRTQGSYGGVGWLELGAFTISSTDLKVVLSNLATGNFVDADGVLLVDPPGRPVIHGGSGPATAGPPSAAGANSTNSSVSIGTLNFAATPPSTNGNGQQSQVISLSGVSQPAALSVSYSQGSQPVVNQSSPSLVDAAIGLGTSDGNGTSASNSNRSEDALTALAQSLISGEENS